MTFRADLWFDSGTNLDCKENVDHCAEYSDGEQNRFPFTFFFDIPRNNQTCRIEQHQECEYLNIGHEGSAQIKRRSCQPTWLKRRLRESS